MANGVVERRMADETPPNPDVRKSLVVVKGFPAWGAWFRRLVKHSRMPGPVLIEIALKEWAERNHFREEPPQR